jgi:L-alanine-DL-glutamate epimerase-like enolase superfamily enzyme
MLRYSIQKETFAFKQPSGTSRGVLTEKHAWFIRLWQENHPAVIGLGECSIIPGLSPDFDDFESYEAKIKELVTLFIEQHERTKDLHSFYKSIEHFPSILFGIEMAYLDLINGGKALFFDTDFTLRQKKIPINGLIWMGDKDFIEKQIEEKLAQGYSCLKMKVGAIHFETELEILATLRQHYPKEKLILRVDANGAFSADEALEKLNRLASLDIHSIEQPIKQGQSKQMAELCQTSLLPIALDEELMASTK